MKKTIKLTESKLVEMINNIVSEQQQQKSIDGIVNRFKKTISEQEVGGYKEGPGDYDHYKKIVEPKLGAAGFTHIYDSSLVQYGTENSMIYGGHNDGINVLWNKPRSGKGWGYIVWMGNNKGKREFPIGGSNQNNIKAASDAVNYALSLKKNFKGAGTGKSQITRGSVNESNTPDPKRIAFFDNLAKQISTKIVGKKYFFGKIGVLDNTSIIVKRYEDRNQAINLPGYPVKEFNLYFLVRRVEEDLNRGEKPGTRVWTGLLSITANFVNGKLSPNPLVELYPTSNGKTDYNGKQVTSKPWTWDMIGGAALWANATTIGAKPTQGAPEPGPTNFQGGLRQIK